MKDMLHPIRKPLFLSLLSLSLQFAPECATGQVYIQVGTGSLTNGANQSPSPYANTQPGSRLQMLFTASELQAAGMSAGQITSIGFDVVNPSGTTLIGYSIRMGATGASALTATWEGGLSSVWGPLDYTDAAGWSEHTLNAPYFWDGTSNLVIDVCHYTGATAGQNARVRQDAFAFTAAVQRNTPNPAVCTDPGGTHIQLSQRPNVRFGWNALDEPPVAGFSAASLGCNGSLAFLDASTNFPSAWQWDFGDGGASSDQNPVHQFASSGTYLVTLIASNFNGPDTATAEVTVLLDWTPPVPACTASSVGTVSGFGILETVIENVTNTTADAATEGYLDATCVPISLLQGTTLDLSVSTGTAASHAIRAWLDLDNSGAFTSNELLLSATGTSATSSTLIGAGAVLNTPLRLRIIAAYDLVTPSPQACGDVQYGQAEDYSVTVLENTLVPIASFTASPLFSCSGTVQFNDLSENVPTGWTWDFGDGGTSTDQSPIHIYAMSGTYSVSLLAVNANGQDDTLSVDLITIDLESQLAPAACAPGTSAYCCGYGLLGFDFAGISSSSPDGIEGYQDRSCGNTALVTEGQSYAWSVVHNEDTPHDTRIWIDLNNDGGFTANELMATALGQVSPAGSIIVPSGALIGTPLRLRVVTDVIGQAGGACDAPLYGQAEDFSAIIAPNTNPPTAAFSASPTVTCDGVVQFTDLSTNLPTGWSWTFGDGGTSSDQDPVHTYTELGTYSVTLTVTNANGSDAQTQGALVHFVPAWQCDTMQVLDNASSSSACVGILTDDGGADGPYTAGTSGAFTISPPGAQFVTLDFSVFQWGNNQNRWLRIYDGPDVTSPLIGQYQGNGLGALPNGGVITSSGPSITLRQEQQGGGGPPPNSAGFVLTWNCSLVSVEEIGTAILSIRPQPADDRLAVDLATSADASRTVILRDILGRTIEQRTVPGSAATIWFDVADHPAGNYVLHVIGAKQTWARNIIIH